MNLLLKFLIILSFLSSIFLNYPKFTSKFDYEKTKNDFNNSPYTLKDNYKTIVRDEDYYALQGYMYAKKTDLNQIIYDHPPFGKFLIGLSIFLTGNQNIFQIFISLFALIAFYYLSKEVLKDNTLALFSSLVLSLELLFREQISTSLLDQDLLLFLTLTLLFTLKSLKCTSCALNENKCHCEEALLTKQSQPNYNFPSGLLRFAPRQARDFARNDIFKKNNKYITASAISIGVFSSIKFPANAIILVITIIFFYLIIKRFDLIKSLIKYFLIVPIIYFILYIPFIDKPSLTKFFDLQIFAIKWHKSHLPDYPKFEIFRLLLFNQWRTWWGSEPFIKVSYFHLLWPLSLINLLIIAIAIFNKKISKHISKEIILIFLWCLLYLAFSSFRVLFPRYLLLLLPFMYLTFLYTIKELFRKLYTPFLLYFAIFLKRKSTKSV